nr:MAG TPA: hypothetical protein [Caudoviricetes sp.]
MSYNTDYLYPISAEDIDSALSSLSIRAAHHQEGWRLLMAIKTRSGLVGRIFDRRSVEAVQKAVGAGYAVTYYIRDYSNGHPRTLLVEKLDEQGQKIPGYRWHWYFELASTQNPRLTAKKLEERLTYHRDQAAHYQQCAAELPQLVNQYNGACDYLRTVRDELSKILIYAEQR